MGTQNVDSNNPVLPLGRMILLGGLIISLISCGSSPPPPQADATWLVRAGERVITVREFQDYLEQQCLRNPKLALTPSRKRELLETYLEGELLAEEAERSGLSQDQKVRKDLEEARKQVLMKYLFERKAAELEKHIQISEEEITRFYADMGREIRFRYLPVPDPRLAPEILAKWSNGEAGSEVVDSGMVRLSSFNNPWKKQLADLLLKKPQLVQIGSEFYVIEVLVKSEKPPAPLHEVKNDILKELTDRQKREMLQKWVSSLKGKRKIEINQAYDWR